MPSLPGAQTRPLRALLRLVRSYGADNGSDLAALLTYYGFLAVLPMLLAATTVLGMLLPGHPELREKVLQSSLVQFPVVGDALLASVQQEPGLTGLVTGLVIGFLGARGFCLVLQRTVVAVWGVPVTLRPRWLSRELRTLGLVGVVAAGALLSCTLSAVATASALRLVLLALAVPGTALLLLALLRIIAPEAVPTHDLRRAAVAGAVGLVALQVVGSRLVVHLTTSQERYGEFALVLGLLAWLYLQARVIVLALEIGKLSGSGPGVQDPSEQGGPDAARVVREEGAPVRAREGVGARAG